MVTLEEEMFMEELKNTYVETYLRIKRLREEKEHSVGCIVRGGKGKKYFYWQKRVNGRQILEYIKPENVPDIEKKIEQMKDKEKRLRELKHFSTTLEKIFQSIGIRIEDVMDEYERDRHRKQQEFLSRRAAQEVAASKPYAENYRHVTDRGEQVASKSELIIANVLYAYGIKYEYERPIEIEGKVFKPDFTIWRKDGTMVLWEHAGLLDDQQYSWDFNQKLRMYQKAGFKMAINLIVTADDNKTFSAVEARKMVELYKLAG